MELLYILKYTKLIRKSSTKIILSLVDIFIMDKP